jgi:hypothetical protein
MTTVTVTGLEEAISLVKLLPKKALFAASIGLNRTADEAQTAVRESLADKFTLRRKAFIEGTIYRKPGEDWATRDKLQARVRIHPERDHLAKFEEGGDKLPTRGRRMVAVPIDPKRTGADIITKRARPKALLASGKAFIRNGAIMQVVGRGKSKTVKAVYILKPRTKIKATLRFHETALKVVTSRAVPNISGAVQVEIDRGLVSRSGVTTK